MKRAPKNPSTLLFWNDLENDEKLKTCSLAAKGLWTVHMLAIAARSIEPGFVLIGDHPCRLDGDLPTLLARVAGETPNAIAVLLQELVTSGTAYVDEQGRVYNQRMVREERIRQARSRAGKGGAAVTNAKRHGLGKTGGEELTVSIGETTDIPKKPTTDARQSVGTGVGKGVGKHLVTALGKGVGKHLVTGDDTAHGKGVGKNDDSGSTSSAGGIRDIPNVSTKDARQNAGEALDDQGSKSTPSSLFMLQASKKDGESLGVETSTAPQARGADERGTTAGSQMARAATRGTRLPDGWQPSPELEQFARDLGLDPARVTPEFVDYWRGVSGQKGIKLDWDATYRNRCRTVAERKGNGTRTRQDQHDDRESPAAAGIAAAIARRSFQSRG